MNNDDTKNNQPPENYSWGDESQTSATAKSQLSPWAAAAKEREATIATQQERQSHLSDHAALNPFAARAAQENIHRPQSDMDAELFYHSSGSKVAPPPLPQSNRRAEMRSEPRTEPRTEYRAEPRTEPKIASNTSSNHPSFPVSSSSGIDKNRQNIAQPQNPEKIRTQQLLKEMKEDLMQDLPSFLNASASQSSNITETPNIKETQDTTTYQEAPQPQAESYRGFPQDLPNEMETRQTQDTEPQLTPQLSTPYVQKTNSKVAPETSRLRAHKLSKSYGGRQVLKEVSFELSIGEAVAILGPNGAGKTTSFYMITGLVKPDKGEVILNGEKITKLPMFHRARLGIGYLPQESSIFRGLSVQNNIMAILETVVSNRAEREAQLESLLGEFNISHLRSQPATSLSGGERRRLEIARALASRPRFILLDEPLAGIDPIAVKDIRELVSHLKQRNIGVLITDHNVRETLAIVDRAYILFDGQVIKSGTANEIIQDTRVQEVYLGDSFSKGFNGE